MRDDLDPKGPIKDSYLIEGISAPECRSIFLDWAISVPEGQVPEEAIRALLERHRASNPDHPMTEVLDAALVPSTKTGRRGGARARRRPD